MVDRLPRVDIPSDWIDVVVVADQPYQLEALFTRDPQNITELQILMAMMALKGIYAEHEVQSLNHGIGFNTAAIELLLPTYGETLGIKGKVAKNWVLNPHPTMIPAIESGWVESIHSFGGEVGMENILPLDPMYSLSEKTARCAAIEHYHKLQVNMPSICLSVRPTTRLSRKFFYSDERPLIWVWWCTKYGA